MIINARGAIRPGDYERLKAIDALVFHIVAF
jgi:hypothetical protein